MKTRIAVATAFAALSAFPSEARGSSAFTSDDLYRLRSVGDAQISPDGKRIAFTVENRDRPGRPYPVIHLYDVNTGKTQPLGGEKNVAAGPRWSPDGKWLAYLGSVGEQSGLVLARADGTEASFLASTLGTNHPVPSTGESFSWSPDSGQIAFVSATEGPEAAAASGDPMVITRYLYKPAAGEGLTRFSDNRRLHIFVVNVATKKVRQLTHSHHHEHSIDWSPAGDEILFVSNRGADERGFNYDVYAVKVPDGAIRQLLSTESVEYRPRWSPDGKTIAYQGTRRGLTSSETTMEDTHIWLMSADGGNRRELSAETDNRQGAPTWAPDGSAVYGTVQERGSNPLYRFPLAVGGRPQRMISEPGSVRAFSVARGDVLAYAFQTPGDLTQLFLKTAAAAAKKLTDLNKELMGERAIGKVEPFTFLSHDGTEVEAFLTHPLGRTPGSRHPLIAMIKGGPHGQQGPDFNHKAQVYAGRGWATLMVNYRGSTGYGQEFADAIFGDQNGGEAKDVLFGVNAALERNAWLDPSRLGVEGGSYGGQLTNWLITQTARFKAAIPIAGISNLVSFNYMSYYHDYLAVEFGAYPHQEDMMDRLWQRSPLRYAARVRTPTLFVHGENDNDVPIAEAEQFYIALKDVGVETSFLRYPREGHGLRETQHVVDLIDRSTAWYEKHLGGGAGAASTTSATR